MAFLLAINSNRWLRIISKSLQFSVHVHCIVVHAMVSNCSPLLRYIKVSATALQLQLAAF